jgi:hypothetical protein
MLFYFFLVLDPLQVVSKDPLAMTMRSASVALMTSTSVRLLPVHENLTSEADGDENSINSDIGKELEEEKGDDGGGDDIEQQDKLRIKTLDPYGETQEKFSIECKEKEEGIVTRKSSDVLLGQVLRHVDRNMIDLGKTLDALSSVANDTNKKERFSVSNKELNTNKSGNKGDNGNDVDENLYLACEVCRSIFALFEPVSSPHCQNPSLERSADSMVIIGGGKINERANQKATNQI